MNDKLKLLEKARVELGEDEQKKRQGVEHGLRVNRILEIVDDDDNEINLHSKYLMRCFSDDEFLVRFLRHSKYSLVRAT
jgi:hypothetical protein